MHCFQNSRHLQHKHNTISYELHLLHTHKNISKISQSICISTYELTNAKTHNLTD